MDTEPLTDYRTITTEYKFDKLESLNSNNVAKLDLKPLDNSHLEPCSSSHHSTVISPQRNVYTNTNYFQSHNIKCDVILDKDTIPVSKIQNTSKNTSVSSNHENSNKVMCIGCNKYFKGRRGLSIHFGRSPNCKHALKSNPIPISECVVDDPISIPQEVKEAINCPSTSVEGLENMCGDGKCTKIKYHQSKHGCKMCHVLSTKDHFISSSTHRIYKSVIPSNIKKIDCNTSNLIYLITCNKCYLQYVGETCLRLRERFNHHNSCIAHPEKDHNCRILSEHFNKGFCKGAAFTVRIIEALEGSGRDENGKMDPSITTIRRKKETEWMLKLRTVSPYGLNDRIGDEYMTERGNNIIFTRFPSLKRYNKHVRVRTKAGVSQNLLIDHFPYIIMESIKTDLRNTMNLIRVLLSSLRKSSYKKLGDIINDFLLNKHDNFFFSHYFLAALDIISANIWKPIQTPKSKLSPNHRCNVTFCNKGIDFINLPRILKEPEVLKLLPPTFNKESPMVVYNLVKPIRSKIFNYKNVLQHLDVDAFLADRTILPCSCADSPFIDEHHGHIITGDLRIVQNNKLRKLLCKGPKFRESDNISWQNAKEAIVLGINNAIKKWTEVDGLPASYFKEWRYKVFQLVDNKISSLKNKIKPARVNKVLSNHMVINYLNDLQDKYVMTPIDKADSNVAFICKRYYVEVLVKELGLAHVHSNTYEPIFNVDLSGIVKQQVDEIHNVFGIRVSKDMQTLPDIYWLPKLHKTPIKARFIIASQKCTVKKLSKDITSIFKLAYKQVETYNCKARIFSDINTFWIIQNSTPVIEAFDKINRKKNAKVVSSFDFSTLYTNIPHAKLFHALSSIINFIFKGGACSYISVNKSGVARWSKRCNNISSSYDKGTILKAVKYLLDNCQFQFGNRLFKQVVGIPMGSDPAPYFANLFLYTYESIWLNRMKKENNILARKFGKIYRFIDDLLAVNDGGEFEKCCSQIYPEELELKKENVSNVETSFLELKINISDNMFQTRLYDKRDAFGFYICRLPFRSSNLPRKMFYSSICAEVLRICRATSNLTDTIHSVRSLIIRMYKQGAAKQVLKVALTRNLNKHHISMAKFNTSTDIIVNEFLH